MTKKNVQVPSDTTTERIAIRLEKPEKRASLQVQIDRLTEHVNREIGVAQDTSLVKRVTLIDKDLTTLYLLLAAYSIFYVIIVVLGGDNGN